MIKALQLVLSGEVYVPAIALGVDMLGLEVRSTWPDEQAEPLDDLTPRERQVLALVCDGHSNKSIAREMGLQQATVGYHLGGVFRKMNVSSRTQAATLAMTLGFTGNRRRAG
jgi:two-component system nitrate/nitrite response regulator NarL